MALLVVEIAGVALACIHNIRKRPQFDRLYLWIYVTIALPPGHRTFLSGAENKKQFSFFFVERLYLIYNNQRNSQNTIASAYCQD